jgi:hypothetical protein
MVKGNEWLARWCTTTWDIRQYRKIWVRTVLKDSGSNSTAKNMFYSKHRGTTRQMNDIVAAHPTYLHYLYNQMTTILSDDATFSEIVTQMNLLPTVDDEWPNINQDKWS